MLCCCGCSGGTKLRDEHFEGCFQVSGELRGLAVIIEVDEDPVEAGLILQALEVLGKQAVCLFAAFEAGQDLVEVGAGFGDVRSKRGLLLLDAEEGSPMRSCSLLRSSIGTASA